MVEENSGLNCADKRVKEEVLKNAKDVVDGQIKLPKVVG